MNFTGTEIAAILAGLATLIGSFKLKEIVDAVLAYRLSRDTKIRELDNKYQKIESKYKGLEFRLSVVIPIAINNTDDPDVINLLNSFLKETNNHTTPAPNND